MSNQTPAQEEFAAFVAKNSDNDSRGVHPEDYHYAAREAAYRQSEQDEEDRYRASRIDDAMRMPSLNGHGDGLASSDLKLPPPSFDRGRSTGVKGVIADARSYENARRSTWKDRVRAARRSVFGMDALKSQLPAPSERSSGADSDGSLGDEHDTDEESFLAQWRESRKRELEVEAKAPVIRNRRTSPSVRMFGRMDEVDALGYLDAIEKVGRDTVVAVFVYDHEVCATPTPLN
jgi:hypothetical protein